MKYFTQMQSFPIADCHGMVPERHEGVTNIYVCMYV